MRMNDLRDLYNEGRRIYDESREASYEAASSHSAWRRAWRTANAARRAHGEKMIAWAETVDTTAPVEGLDHAVRMAFATVIKASASLDQNPGWEVFCQPPEVEGWEGSGSWRICWESGPYDWAVGDSLGAARILPYRLCSGRGFYTEPHYGFDLIYVESCEPHRVDRRSEP